MGVPAISCGAAFLVDGMIASDPVDAGKTSISSGLGNRLKDKEPTRGGGADKAGAAPVTRTPVHEILAARTNRQTPYASSLTRSPTAISPSPVTNRFQPKYVLFERARNVESVASGSLPRTPVA